MLFPQAVYGLKGILVIKKFVAVTAGLFAAAFVSVSSAGAVPISFDRITSNSPADAAGQLSAEITDNGTGVLISFAVADGANPDANITEIYFSDLLTLFAPPPSVFSQSAGVSFETGGSNTPGELPGGSGFTTTAGLVAEADGNNATGLTVGETLVLSLTYAMGMDFSDVLAALDSGNFRIGLHVRSLLDGESDAFVSEPPAEVPLPAAAWLMIAGLGGLRMASRKKAA